MFESFPNFHSEYGQKSYLLFGEVTIPMGPTTSALIWQKPIFKDPIFFVSFCAMRLWHTILETFQQPQQQSRARFFNFGLQPEIRGAKFW